MRIAQLILEGASAYERKSQSIDFTALSERHEVRVLADGERADSDVVHVYGPPGIDARSLQSLTLPFVANASPARRRFTFRKSPQPRAVLTPLLEPAPPSEYVPEAVDDSYFLDGEPGESTPVIGSFSRPSVMNAVEQTMARIDRFREDVTWRLFDTPPTVEDILSVSVWVDPAIAAADYDGFVAEAVSAGVLVVAAATPLNVQRLEKGRTGFLVPPQDPNEMTHAILAALFKPEEARAKRDAARQTVVKFRARHRIRALEKIYGRITQ